MIWIGSRYNELVVLLLTNFYFKRSCAISIVNLNSDHSSRASYNTFLLTTLQDQSSKERLSCRCGSNIPYIFRFGNGTRSPSYLVRYFYIIFGIRAKTRNSYSRFISCLVRRCRNGSRGSGSWFVERNHKRSETIFNLESHLPICRTFSCGSYLSSFSHIHRKAPISTYNSN